MPAARPGQTNSSIRNVFWSSYLLSHCAAFYQKTRKSPNLPSLCGPTCLTCLYTTPLQLLAEIKTFTYNSACTIYQEIRTLLINIQPYLSQGRSLLQLKGEMGGALLARPPTRLLRPAPARTGATVRALGSLKLRVRGRGGGAGGGETGGRTVMLSYCTPPRTRLSMLATASSNLAMARLSMAQLQSGPAS